MADKRYNESTLGNPGRLEYYPPEVRRAEEQGWLTVRNHDVNVPRFRELGSHHEWFPHTRQKPSPAPSTGTWHESRKQKRWLLKNHPEAAIGNEEIGEILAVEIPSRQLAHASSWQFTQFAIGEMADTSSGQKVVAAPLLAMAAGSAGDILRLVRPAANLWHVEENSSRAVQLLEHVKHQETLWTNDIGTIRCIRAVVSTKRFEPVRWLIVQRDFGTSVFRPEYQKAPVVSESFSRTSPQPPSHIAPNLLFTIPKSQTGNNAHCDAAFNPGVKAKPAQLAIVDEGGNWTVWDVTGTRGRAYKHPRIRLHKCGSIRHGVRGRLSRRLSPKPLWHRILWVGRSAPNDDDSDDEDFDTAQSASSFPPLERSSVLLVCNQKAIRLLDLEANNFLPDLQLIPDGSKDLILNVQADSQDTRYFYVVTTSRLFVAAVFATEDFTLRRMTWRATVLESFPHLRSKLDRDLKITVNPGPLLSSNRTARVVLYSQYSNWHDVFCIGFSKRFPDRITCHHASIVSQDTIFKNTDRGLQTLCLNPTPFFTQQRSGFVNTENVRSNRDMNYFQLFSFRTDLSLSYCLGASSTVESKMDRLTIQRIPGTDLMDATEKHYRSKLDKISRQELERQGAIRYLSTRFVVADSIGDFRYGRNGAVSSKTVTTRARKERSRMIAPLYAEFRSFLTALWAEGDDFSMKIDVYGAAPFDPVFIILQEALETRSLPRKSMFDIVQNFRVPEDYKETSREWQAEIDQLQSVDPALQVTRLNKSQRTINVGRSLRELFSSLVGLILGGDHSELESDDSNGLVFVWLCQVACELYLSQYGITYMPLEITEPLTAPSMDIRSSPTLMPEDMLIDSQDSIRSTFRSSSLALDSQASSRASTPTSTALSGATEVKGGNETGSHGISLIRALTGTGIIKSRKNIKLPSPWNVGEDSSNTVFSINTNTEVTEGMRRRAKQEAREARKRKRVETLLQLQREHNLLPSTQPPSKTNMFSQTSQPMGEFSSQPRVLSSAPPIAMSQPMPGAFGGRSDFERPKKKPKRKGGF